MELAHLHQQTHVALELDLARHKHLLAVSLASHESNKVRLLHGELYVALASLALGNLASFQVKNPFRVGAGQVELEDAVDLFDLVFVCGVLYGL